MLFTFAGSSRSNYMHYVLETILALELESTPELRDALLRCLLLNLMGHDGQYAEGDFVMEFFNRLVEMVVDLKSAEFDANFVRNVLSRNLAQIAALKVAWRVGAGMKAKSSNHKQAHTRPEMRILLALYRALQLHYYRVGRVIDDRDTDDFSAGVSNLRRTALKAHVARSRSMWGKPSSMATATPDEELREDETTDVGLDEIDNNPLHKATRGSMFYVDGELIIDDRDMLDGISDDLFDTHAPEQDSEEVITDAQSSEDAFADGWDDGDE